MPCKPLPIREQAEMQQWIWLLTSEVESPQGSGSIHHRQAAMRGIPTDRSLFLLDDPYLESAVDNVRMVGSAIRRC